MKDEQKKIKVSKVDGMTIMDFNGLEIEMGENVSLACSRLFNMKERVITKNAVFIGNNKIPAYEIISNEQPDNATLLQAIESLTEQVQILRHLVERPKVDKKVCEWDMSSSNESVYASCGLLTSKNNMGIYCPNCGDKIKALK